MEKHKNNDDSYRPDKLTNLIDKIEEKLKESNSNSDEINIFKQSFRFNSKKNYFIPSSKKISPKYGDLKWYRLKLRNQIGPYNCVHVMPYTVEILDNRKGISYLDDNQRKECDIDTLKLNNDNPKPKKKEKAYFPDLDPSTGNVHLWNANTIQFVLVTNNVCDLPRECMKCIGCNNDKICGGFFKCGTGYGPGIKKAKDENGNECINEFCYSKSTGIELKNIDINDEQAIEKTAEVLVEKLNDFINEKRDMLETKENK